MAKGTSTMKVFVLALSLSWLGSVDVNKIYFVYIGLRYHRETVVLRTYYQVQAMVKSWDFILIGDKSLCLN